MPGPRVLAAICGALLCASGLLAQTEIFCDSSRCMNGGTCLKDRGDSFHCICPEGFTGRLCNETDKGPCSPNPCHHDGQCQVAKDQLRGDVFISYFCQCPRGYTGIHCETPESLNSQGGALAAQPSADCSMPLGMEGGAIGDWQLSASSVHLGFLGLQRWGPELARLRRTGLVNAWTASNYDQKPWIQVNLLRKMRVTGVVTQGASRAGTHEYLKTFKVAYSLDGRKFQFIQDEEGSGDKEFEGNMDNNSLKINMFKTPLETQYVRLFPVDCRRGCTLRFELLGCELNVCSGHLGLKDGSIPDRQITASSSYKTLGLRAFGWYPFYGRLDRQGKFNAWAAQGNDADEWLQVDLGSQRQVTGIITQGARDFGYIQYVAAYKVAYSDNGKTWTEYREAGATESKIFLGNSDNYSHKKNMFEKPFMARYVRVLPVSWHNRITLRLELLGC
ncbi:lactadherin-like [Perognathus longimembris pacificus]|uniref:lactadherin-like n=1 Tax=Perognathus longimembris pacificus TaxID=214514 RepID=UPI0020189E52|nr:lactadherin-like [Perognathus longimembris pacificus]